MSCCGSTSDIEMTTPCTGH